MATVAPAVVPGCLFGMCGLSPSSAQWDDPQLFTAIPPMGHHGNATAIWTSPGPGLPFNRTMDASWGPHNLTSLSRATGMGRFHDDPMVGMDADHISTTRDNRTPESTTAQALREFVANVSDLSPSEVDAYVQAMLRNGTEQAGGAYWQDDEGNLIELSSVSYGAPLPSKLRLERLLERLESVGAVQVAFASIQAGPWSFGFDIEHRKLVADDQSWRLETDPSGRAEFQGLGAGERPAKSYEKDVRDVLDEYALPQPDEMHVGGSIC